MNSNANNNVCSCQTNTDIRGRCSPKYNNFRYCTLQVDTVYWYLTNDFKDTGLLLDECETLEDGLQLIHEFASERKWKLSVEKIRRLKAQYIQDWVDNRDCDDKELEHVQHCSRELAFEIGCDCCGEDWTECQCPEGEYVCNDCQAKKWTSCRCLCSNCDEKNSICKGTCSCSNCHGTYNNCEYTCYIHLHC